MPNSVKPGQIVFTNKARCRDCYRCIRVCPVKAIRMENDQAFVVEERCIACGTCIRECQQNAKQYRNDLDRVRKLLNSQAPVAVSLAPSFSSVWTGWEQKRIISALRKLGFSYVGETAIGAFPVAVQTAAYAQAHPEKTHIATACPAVVNYIEQYRPEFVDNLVPIVSPMMAHARHIKTKLGKNVRVVFIGPCVAKKSEAERDAYADDIDCAITFEELTEWLALENIALDQLEESDFDEQAAGDARLFPLVGGQAQTAQLPADPTNSRVLTVSGFDDLTAALEMMNGEDAPLVIEPLFCHQGCISGPAISNRKNIFRKREEVIDYAVTKKRAEDGPAGINLNTNYAEHQRYETPEITEAAIRKVLSETGQVSPEDELNCGACGYPTCRDRAIAVLQGMAEPEMCIPYMRRIAEQRGDRIIETSPNGIVILDEKLRILSMNPAFRRMFMCTEAISGRRIAYLMDPQPFENLLAKDEPVIESTVEHEKYGVVCHQILYRLEEENQLVGIFVNITQNRENVEKLEKMRQETVMQAQELLDHQIKMAQKVAEYLGESTARGEVLVGHLLKLTEDERKQKKKENKNNPLWDIYTSK